MNSFLTNAKSLLSAATGQQAQSSQEIEHPTAKASAIASSNDITSSNSAAVDPCTGCQRPCELHTGYPESLAIAWTDDMRDSFKAHRRHLLVAQHARLAEQWSEEVADEGSYIRALQLAIESARHHFQYAVRVSAVEAAMIEEDEQSGELDDDVERFADLYLLPDMLVFPRVSVDALNDFVRAVLVEDRARLQALAGIQQRHAQLQSVVRSALASQQQQSQPLEPSLDLEFEHRAIPGVLLLVCAHKKRDRRCGIAGPILARELQARSLALRELSDSSADIHYAPVTVLKVSHLGGHKFAALCNVMPQGDWLARVLPCHADLIIDAYARSNKSSGDPDMVSSQALLALHAIRRGHIEW